MESSSDKHWATQYLLDPLTAPQPSQETGPGTSFRPEPSSLTATPPSKSPSTTTSTNRLSKNNPYRDSLGSPKGAGEIIRSSSVRSAGNYPSPPYSASSVAGQSPSYRQETFGESRTHGRRRGSSLGENFPGDMSHRPLDQLTKEKAIANKSRHTTRRHRIHPDSIDSLDDSAGRPYHHGGPYDATLYARNNSADSPLNALSDSNAETLKATPKEKIVDSVKGHRPLDGVAAYAPGEADRNGHVYNYERGDNMMIDNNPEGGAYKRWSGMQYHPDDIKGKGEPSYSIEKALKEHDKGEKQREGNSFEMRSRPGTGHGTGSPQNWNEPDGKLGRSGSLSNRLSGGGLKKRIGSLKRHLHNEN